MLTIGWRLRIGLMLRVWLRVSLRMTTISPLDITISRIIYTITASVIVAISTVTVQTITTE